MPKRNKIRRIIDRFAAARDRVTTPNKRKRKFLLAGGAAIAPFLFPARTHMPRPKIPEIKFERFAPAEASKKGIISDLIARESRKLRRLIFHSPVDKKTKQRLLRNWETNTLPDRFVFSMQQKRFENQRIYQFSLTAERYARINRLKPELIYWLIESESNWNPNAIARNPQSIGLMQVTETAVRAMYKLEKQGKLRKYGISYKLPKQINLRNPRQNILMGTTYYKLCLEMLREKSPFASEEALERMAIVAYKQGIDRVIAQF